MNTSYTHRQLGARQDHATLRAVLSLAFAVLIAQTASAGWKAGDKLPDLKGFGLEGQIPNLSGKIVIVDFWASWCGPCKASFPILEDVYKRYKDRGVIVLGVNVDETAEDMKKFLENRQVSFPIVRDGKQRLVEAASVEGMPTSFMVDGTGVIKSVHKGFHPGKTEDQLSAEIEALLKSAKGVK